MTRIVGRVGLITLFSIVLPLLSCSPANSASSDVQKEWENCLLSVLHTYKKGTAATPTSARDQMCVGMMYVRGYEGSKNPAKATPLFQKASDAGNPVAMTMLANAYMQGHGVNRDPARALQLFRQAADRGQTDAMLTLGQFSARGTGVPQDRTLAHHYVKEAADKGNLAAWTALQLFFGPAAEDLNKAIDLYRDNKAADAAPYFRRAADQGNIRAQFQVGWMLDKGEGMPSDPANAVVWYRKAADQGDGEAAAALGQLFENGKGLAENYISAAEWYALSAKIGDPMGTFLYGRAFQCGIGVPQNRGEAIVWFWRAEARGHPEGGRWGRWLRGEGNDIGACSQRERDVMGMSSSDPVGITFHNSTERLNWLSADHAASERVGAWVDWSTRRSEYQACTMAGGSNCREPGIEPPKP